MKIANRHCPRCARVTRQEISCRMSASAAAHYGWWCLECKWWTKSKNGGVWIAKDLLEAYGVDLSTVPVVVDADAKRCARCGARGAEEHHWAPQGMFGPEEANRWPKDYLCPSCHGKWHRMVTPQLVAGNF